MSCAACVHRSRARTCLEQVAAGLAKRFEIAYPPDGHAYTCSARADREIPALRGAPGYVHDRPALDEAELARLGKRVVIFRRRGLPSPRAEAIAYRLAQRDHDKDGRRMCIECNHLQRDGGCFAARQGWLPCIDKRYAPATDQLQRCERFTWQRT